MVRFSELNRVDKEMTLQEQAARILPFVKAMADGEVVEVSDRGVWLEKKTPTFSDDCEYRIRPKTITVNGFEVPGPMAGMPGYGVRYFYPSTLDSEFHGAETVSGGKFHRRLFSRGLCHSTKEAAIAHAKAMLGIDPNE